MGQFAAKSGTVTAASKKSDFRSVTLMVSTLKQARYFRELSLTAVPVFWQRCTKPVVAASKTFGNNELESGWGDVVMSGCKQTLGDYLLSFGGNPGNNGPPAGVRR